MKIAQMIIIILMARSALPSQVCASVSQAEILESASPGHLVVDIKRDLERITTTNLNGFYLSDEQEFFQLTQGRITLRKPIDREDYCSNLNKHQIMVNSRCCSGECCIFVGISSKDTAKSKIYVRIKIKDVNDNSPKFPEPLYIQEFLENTKINNKISLPKAIDPDDMFNSISKYEIESSDETFQKYFRLVVEDVLNEMNILTSKQPILVVKEPIDREVINQLEFNLIAKDGGVPSREGKTKIILKILDENDNEPQFSKSSFKISVNENEMIGTDLLTLIVEDKDSDSNGRVTIGFALFSTHEIQSTFQISTARNTAIVRLISKLNYEAKNLYKLDLIAKDHGHPPRSSTVVIEITVLNVNDERPDIMFYNLGKPLSKPFSRIDINEGNQKDEIVCMVKVSDLDSPAESISCQLESSVDFFYLSLIKTNRLFENKQTYELRSKISFDRELRNIYDVNILCSDTDNHAELSQSGKLQVNIKDRNDNAPRFSQSHYYGSVKENKVNEPISIKNDKIRATDIDEAENGTVEYYLEDVSNNLKQNFVINKNNAAIKVTMGLDYEVVKKVTLIIGAKDLGRPSMSSSATLILNVEDTNDNQLEVEASFYPFEVFENEPVGTFVGRINVTDRDTDLNNKRVIMKIKATHSDSFTRTNERADQTFSIDSESGRIFTKIMLDREKSPQITFTILAYNPSPLDLEYNRLESNSHFRETVEIPVSVTILNKNDNNPMMVLRDKPDVKALNPEVVFYRPHQTENHVQDNCVSFPYIFMDEDDMDTAKITTTMKGSTFFSLNMDQGVVCVVNPLPPNGSYRVIIVAEDGDINDTRSQEFLVNIVIKEDPNVGIDRQHVANKVNEPKGPDRSIRSNNKSFRNNLLYAIIGSIAAALLLLIIVILVGFKKFTNGDRNYETKPTSPDNVQDYLECQNFFEYVPDSKYNDLSFAPVKVSMPLTKGSSNPLLQNYQPQSLKFQSELDFRNLNPKYTAKYSFADPMIQEMEFGNFPVGNVILSDNYQAITSQLSSDKNNQYHTLSNPGTNILQRKDSNIDSVNSHNKSQISVASHTLEQPNKTKKSNIKSIFQSTFV